MKRLLLTLACLVPLAAGTNDTSASDEAAPRPHVVLLVADDLGWADVSFHGGEVATPNIDRIAREGAELSRFYVCPVCSPTRAGLLTGRYPVRYGLMRTVVPPWREGGLDLEEITLPEALAGAGYEHRGCFGKWHLGHSSRDYHPLNRGFTEFVGHYNGAIDYFTLEREGERDWHRGFAPSSEQGYSTDLIAEAASRFIEAHADGEAPFFCYVPFNAPHSPFQAKKEHLEQYRHLADEETHPKAWPGPVRRRKEEGRRGRGQGERQTLAAMIASMDEGVGRILDTLDEQGIADNTLVWFFSDNGGEHTADNGPLRGGKHTVWEGGIRAAAALRWPERVEAGGGIDAHMGYIDVLPTLLTLAGRYEDFLGDTENPLRRLFLGRSNHREDSHGGVEIAEEAGKTSLKLVDGKDMSAVIMGKRQGEDRTWHSLYRFGEERQISLHQGRWKLVEAPVRKRNGPQKLHLFDIEKDPNETTNLADQYPEVVAELLPKMLAFENLEPEGSVVPYGEGRKGFKAPENWDIRREDGRK